MNKLITFEDKTKFLEGINILADAVTATLGPKGRNVIIGQQLGAPHITKDGVTVAKSIQLKEPFANAGAQLLKEVAIRVCDEAGDGTTTATCLSQAIIEEGNKILQNNQINAIMLKRSIDNAVKFVVDYIKNNSIEIGDNYDKIKNVATISANNDSEIGTIVADAFKLAGKDGVITVEESNEVTTSVTKIDGIRFDRGYMSPYFVTDPETNVCELHNPMIVLCPKKIENVKSIVPILEQAQKLEKSILMIVENIDTDSLNTLVLNHVKGIVKLCIVRAPGFGDTRKEWWKDLVALTYKDVNSGRQFGSARKVIITKDSTSIIDGESGEPLKLRIEELKSKLNDAENKQFIEQEIARLNGGVALIKVGATSEVEVKEIKDRIDDALCATRSAIAEGVVCGGGLTYLNASNENPGYTNENALGWQVIKNAIRRPLYSILYNSGYSENEITDIMNKCNTQQGFNAKTETFEDFISSGIIDPAKVERVALESAASIAGLYLTSGCIIVNDNEI